MNREEPQGSSSSIVSFSSSSSSTCITKCYCKLFILGILLCFRFCNVYFIRTTYNIDEYWQGPEIAYSLVYPERGGYRTWEWQNSSWNVCHGKFLYNQSTKLPRSSVADFYSTCQSEYFTEKSQAY